MPIRTGNSNARWASTAASTADLGEANAAQTPSPVCLNNQPPCSSTVERKTSSCAARAFRIKSASFSHRRVEPSISVNRKVTIPEGGPPADTRTGCHTKPTTTQQIAADFRDSRMSSISRQTRDRPDGLTYRTAPEDLEEPNHLAQSTTWSITVRIDGSGTLSRSRVRTMSRTPAAVVIGSP